MPTAPEPAAAAAARAEASQWATVAEWSPRPWQDVAPTEAAVVGYYDPAADLERRAAAWGHRLVRPDLVSLARFGAGLAMAEADAWHAEDAVVATRAYAERRFLLGDRVLHWAVPWLDAVGRCYPQWRNEAHARRDLLLDLGDRHRPAPDLGLSLTAPGEDAFGPRTVDGGDLLRSLWSGAVLLDATVASLGGTLSGDSVRRDLATLYEVAAVRWKALAETRPGSAVLWRDLGRRAQRTADDLAADRPT
jgi:hypothetical protein